MTEHPEMKYFSVSELENSLRSVRLEDFIKSCEKSFLHKLFEISTEIAWNSEIKAVFISGPTSSGKTTTTDRLAGGLHFCGKEAVRLSLDDYYIPHHNAGSVNGRKDLESITTLDVEAIHRDLEMLLEGKRVKVPRFDFPTRTRVYDQEDIQLKEKDILLVEGLHGLSEEIAGSLDSSQWYGIMLRPWATLISDRRLLSPRDIRMLRRSARDVYHRNTPALATIDYWPMLDATEEAFFPEYIQRADVFINTAFAYEFCVIPQLAKSALQADLLAYENGNLKTSPYVADGLDYADIELAVEEAKRLVKACDELPAVSPDRIPPISILNEFIH